MAPRLLVYTWPYAAVFWGMFFLSFIPELPVVVGRREPSDAPHDAHSKPLIVIGQWLAVVAAFALARIVPSAAVGNQAGSFWIGVGAMLAGSVLRRHCRQMLGRSFTGAVIVNPTQTVVERGAYRYVRHPSYTAGTILFLGIGLALGNWLSLVVLMVAVPLVYAYRVRVEERALVAVIGDPYRRYMSRTKRFVPRVF
jgi:protein-S-isoprenylcysteine O-methyltransferase Ste14